MSKRSLPEDRYRSANSNQEHAFNQEQPAGPAHGETAPLTQAIHQVVDTWSIGSFQRERAKLRSGGTRHRRRLAAFVVALYDGDLTACRQIAAEAVIEGGGPQAAAQSLLGPAALRLDADWASDAIDFLAVTIALQRLQRLFHELTANDPPGARHEPSRRLLLAPSPGDQHGFGLSIVDDAFQRAGWRVDCCPDDDAGLTLFRRARARHYAAIGISFSADRSLADLQALVTTLRAHAGLSAPQLMAGGRLALEHPRLLLAAGFDIVALDAATAIRDAELFGAAAWRAPFTP